MLKISFRTSAAVCVLAVASAFTAPADAQKPKDRYHHYTNKGDTNGPAASNALGVN
jgi:hypothetical protein